MPRRGEIRSAEDQENYWNSRLAAELQRIGFPSAGFERRFRVRKGELHPKPDISFRDGGVHIVSGKWGEQLELKSVTSAIEYKENLTPVIERHGERIGEVFAVTYPKRPPREKFHLHVLPRPGRDELSLTLDSLEELAAEMKAAVEGLIADLERRAEPVLEEARRLLRWGAEDLALSIRGITLGELEAIFGGHDFFHSVLQHRLKGEARSQALRLGAAYLFVNQVLFYVLLSRAAERAGTPDLYPPVRRDQFGSPKVLREEYFERVHLKNYEPVYGLNVAQFLRGRGCEEACKELVGGIVGLAPKLDVPDLVGQVFQTLIPFEIRKPLGAHYTNPRAARLLATLAIDRPDLTVLDPACGSGTLLVAAYRQKMALAETRERRELHGKFMEADISGIDAMAFAAHLAAVNLALQEPLLETDHVRIGVRDSTTLRPGMDVEQTAEALSSELTTATLDHDFSTKKKGSRRVGPVALKRERARSFRLDPVDLVIMNPPFTRWSTMSEAYRDAVRLTFSAAKAEYRQAITKRPGQHLFFLLLADRFLKEGAKVASVLPQATFKEAAYQEFVRFFLRNYTVRVIVLGLGQASFSEDTSLTECLLLAEKRPPRADSTFVLIGTRKRPDEWNSEEIERTAEKALRGEEGSDSFAVIRIFPQAKLALEAETLTGLYLRLLPNYDRALSALFDVMERSPIPVLPFSRLFERLNFDVGRGIETAEHFSYYGSKALLACRKEAGMGQVDRLVYSGQVEDTVVLRDRIGGKAYRFPSSAIRPALRAAADYDTIDVSGKTDFCVARSTSALKEAMTDMYGTREARTYMARVGRRWSRRVAQSSSGLLLFRRGDLSAPGTRLLCFRADEPTLQAGTNYIFENLDNPGNEKALCLWLNSTPCLLWMLQQVSITRGAFVTLEKFGVERLVVPDITQLSESHRRAVDLAYERLRNWKLPSLLDQLETHHEARMVLDGLCLQILGVREDNEKKQIGTALQTGAAEALRALKKTMGGEELTPEEEQGGD